MKPSGLQVSFFKAVEMLEVHFPSPGDKSLEVAIGILGQALSERQRAELDDRVAAYRARRAQAQDVELRRQEREAAAHERGGCGAARCRSCNRFKSRPSSICDYCGDDPVGNVTNGQPDEGDRREFDRAVWGQ